MKKIKLLSLLLLVTSTFAANDSATIKLIKTNLKKNLPELKVDAVVATKFTGVYEIDAGRKVFYVDNTGNLALVGNMIDLTNKVNLTDQRTEELNVVKWSSLNTDVAIRHDSGVGKTRIAVFTDPDCPFCKRYENDTLSKLKDVSVYYYLFPLAIHPSAESDSRKILCSTNPEQTLLNFMGEGKALPANDKCDAATKLNKMMSVATDVVGVTGTPTTVLPNGKVVSGLLTLDYLNKLIDENPEPESSVVIVKKAQ